MSLDVNLIKKTYLTCQCGVKHEIETESVYWANITHSLGEMAQAAGIYDCVWRPDENGFETVTQLIKPLKEGIKRMEADPERFKRFDSPNGWGTYDQFLPWLKRYLEACEENPDALIEVSR